MADVILCTRCGSRAAGPLAPNERDLAEVGMLERHCARCGEATRWGRAEDYRRGGDRRKGERRKGIGRWTGEERRRADRRTGRDRRGS